MRIDVKDKPLNEVFLDLKNQYQAQFSFDNDALSNCSVNSTKEFSDLDEAVFELAANCRFSVKKTLMIVRKSPFCSRNITPH